MTGRSRNLILYHGAILPVVPLFNINTIQVNTPVHYRNGTATFGHAEYFLLVLYFGRYC